MSQWVENPAPKGVTVVILMRDARKTATYGYTQMRTRNALKIKTSNNII